MKKNDNAQNTMQEMVETTDDMIDESYENNNHSSKWKVFLLGVAIVIAAGILIFVFNSGDEGSAAADTSMTASTDTLQISEVNNLPKDASVDQDVEEPKVIVVKVEDSSSEPEPDVVVTPESIWEEFVKSRYGKPKKTNTISTIMEYDERYAKTGVADALTTGYTPEEVISMVLSNSIVAQSLGRAEQAIGLASENDAWLEKLYTEDSRYWSEARNNGKIYQTLEYTLGIAPYLVAFESGLQVEDIVSTKDWTVVKRFPLAPASEKVIEVAGGNNQNFYAFQYNFSTGTKYLGINTKTGEFAVLEAPKTGTVKTKPAPVEKEPTKTPVAKKDPTPVNKTKDKNPVTAPTPTPTPNPVAKTSCTPNNGPDATGAAPVGGVGEDGVDDLGPGILEPEPTHVLADNNSTNDTRIFITIPTSDTPDVHVDYNPLPDTPDTGINAYRTNPNVINPDTGAAYIDPSTAPASALVSIADQYNDDSVVDFDLDY